MMKFTKAEVEKINEDSEMFYTGRHDLTDAEIQAGKAEFTFLGYECRIVRKGTGRYEYQTYRNGELQSQRRSDRLQALWIRQVEAEALSEQPGEKRYVLSERDYGRHTAWGIGEYTGESIEEIEARMNLANIAMEYVDSEGRIHAMVDFANPEDSKINRA